MIMQIENLLLHLFYIIFMQNKLCKTESSVGVTLLTLSS